MNTYTIRLNFVLAYTLSFILKSAQMYNKAYNLPLKYPVSSYILSFYDNCQVSFFFLKILKLLNSMYVSNGHFTWAKR